MTVPSRFLFSCGISLLFLLTFLGGERGDTALEAGVFCRETDASAAAAEGTERPVRRASSKLFVAADVASVGDSSTAADFIGDAEEEAEAPADAEADAEVSSTKTGAMRRFFGSAPAVFFFDTGVKRFTFCGEAVAEAAFADFLTGTSVFTTPVVVGVATAALEVTVDFGCFILLFVFSSNCN